MNESPIVESNSTAPAHAKKDHRSLIFVIAVIVAIIVGTLTFNILLSAEHHKQYATGQEYAVTGTIAKASDDLKHPGSRSTNREYCVELLLDESLPNGGKYYESTEKTDYKTIERYAADHATHFKFTIDQNGYLESATPIV